jgi:hypothetical protein
MILIIGQTFVNLSPGQVWKAPHNVIDAGTVDDQTDYVVHPNPSALHNRIAPADIGHIDQVTVTSRWHGFTLVRQANLEKAILEALRLALIHRPNQIRKGLRYEVRQFRRVILISVSPASPNSRATRQLEFQRVGLETTPADVSTSS